MIDNDEYEHRLRELRALEERGLMVRRELPDGSAELYFPKPDHPDVLAFRAARPLHCRQARWERARALAQQRSPPRFEAGPAVSGTITDAMPMTAGTIAEQTAPTGCRQS
jgi:hypothetical protein